MQAKLRISLLLIISVLTCSAAWSQVRHVTTCNPLSPNNSEYIEVYEYDYVDVQPQFPGGESALMNYINKTREYPYHAYQSRIQGRVLCSFIVHADGKISNIQVIRGAGDLSLNREAIRVISKMPKWKAGKINNKSVAVRCVLPIAFRL